MIIFVDIFSMIKLSLTPSATVSAIGWYVTVVQQAHPVVLNIFTGGKADSSRDRFTVQEFVGTSLLDLSGTRSGLGYFLPVYVSFIHTASLPRGQGCPEGHAYSLPAECTSPLNHSHVKGRLLLSENL